MTEYVFLIDYAIFSVFISLFLTEFMGSYQLIFNWKNSSDTVIQYITPIWEITGTFAAFWVVASDFIFPSAILPVAYLYSGGIMVFLIFFVARNAAFVYGEYMNSGRFLSKRFLMYSYGFSTFALALIALFVISGIIGAGGVNTQNLSFNFGQWIIDPYSWMFLVSGTLISWGLSYMFFDVGASWKTALVVFAGLLTGSVSLYSMDGAGFSILPVISAILISLVALSSLTEFRIKKLFFIPLLSISVFLTYPLVYPYAFHHTLNVNSLMNNGPLLNSFLIITVFGLILLSFLFLVMYRAMKNKKSLKIQ
ncbi:hypothetical protein [Caldiplasma sukawensis]